MKDHQNKDQNKRKEELKGKEEPKHINTSGDKASSWQHPKKDSSGGCGSCK